MQAPTAQELTAIGKRLGLDPLKDLDLSWIVQEFVNAPLPVDWKVVRAPNGEYHYINNRLRYDLLTNPVEPRFVKLVKMIKASKSFGTPLDEVTVLELMDPIERPSDVRDMSEYQGIIPSKEMHLLWIAKLALLESLPEGWEEVTDATGMVVYRNIEDGFTTEEHPSDDYFQTLLERERGKRVPYQSICLRHFEQPYAHFRNDKGKKGETLRTQVVPASGTYLQFYDLYGTPYWYDFTSGRITTDLMEVRRVPAATVIQRIWRGYCFRLSLYREHFAAMRVGRAWQSFRFRKLMQSIRERREASVVYVQRKFRARKVAIDASKELYKKLAAKGSKSRRLARIQLRTGGLQETNYRFVVVRAKVIQLQRALRKARMKQMIRERLQPKPWPHSYYVVRHAVYIIQRNFRKFLLMRVGAEGGAQQKGLAALKMMQGA